MKTIAAVSKPVASGFSRTSRPPEGGHHVVLKPLLASVLVVFCAAPARAGQDPPPQPPSSQELVPLTTCVAATRSELRLDRLRDGMLYVPKGYKADQPLPLLVWLHGAGGSGNVSAGLSALADEFTIIVLAPDSREWTWGSILGDWDPDLEFLQLAMRQAQTRCSVARERIWLGGFSDGASFSLSLGISYGNVFRRVYAGSPGLMQPIAA